VKIRPERDGEQAAIWKINEEAFGRAVEADLVDAIRASDRFVPELSLVAEDGGELIGHVLLSYVRIEPGGHPVLQLGPLAVLPSHQGRARSGAPRASDLFGRVSGGQLARVAERRPAYAARLRPGAGECVEREDQARCARCGPAFLSASVPVHGRVPFIIGTRIPAL
jgi:putative acetyltransferase